MAKRLHKGALNVANLKNTVEKLGQARGLGWYSVVDRQIGWGTGG